MQIIALTRDHRKTFKSKELKLVEELIERSAETLIQEEGVIRLTAEESRHLMAALLAPPSPPTAAAKKALARYRQTVLSDVNPASQG